MIFHSYVSLPEGKANGNKVNNTPLIDPEFGWSSTNRQISWNFWQQNKGVITPLMLGRLPLGTLKPYMKYCQMDVTFNRCLDSWWIVIYYIAPNIYFRIRGTRNGILDVDGYPLVICYIAIEAMAPVEIVDLPIKDGGSFHSFLC